MSVCCQGKAGKLGCPLLFRAAGPDKRGGLRISWRGLPEARVEDLPVPEFLLLGVVPLGHRPKISHHPAIDFAGLIVFQGRVLMETGVAFQVKAVRLRFINPSALDMDAVCLGDCPDGYRGSAIMAVPHPFQNIFVRMGIKDLEEAFAGHHSHGHLLQVKF